MTHKRLFGNIGGTVESLLLDELSTIKGFLNAIYIGINKSVVFLVDCDSSEELQEVLIKECNYHLKMIRTKDKEYFNDCDEEYLKGDWQKLIKKILKILNKY